MIETGKWWEKYVLLLIIIIGIWTFIKINSQDTINDIVNIQSDYNSFISNIRVIDSNTKLNDIIQSINICPKYVIGMGTLNYYNKSANSIFHYYKQELKNNNWEYIGQQKGIPVQDKDFPKIYSWKKQDYQLDLIFHDEVLTDNNIHVTRRYNVIVRKMRNIFF